VSDQSRVKFLHELENDVQEEIKDHSIAKDEKADT